MMFIGAKTDDDHWCKRGKHTLRLILEINPGGQKKHKEHTKSNKNKHLSGADLRFFGLFDTLFKYSALQQYRTSEGGGGNLKYEGVRMQW